MNDVLNKKNVYLKTALMCLKKFMGISTLRMFVFSWVTRKKYQYFGRKKMFVLLSHWEFLSFFFVVLNEKLFQIQSGTYDYSI